MPVVESPRSIRDSLLFAFDEKIGDRSMLDFMTLQNVAHEQTEHVTDVFFFLLLSNLL